MAAVATAPETRVYDALVRFLAEKEEALPISDLPEKMADRRILSLAWIDGMIEFGRRNHVVTGKAGSHSERTGLILIFEDGYTWTGAKKTTHKPLKDMLADQLPTAQEYRSYQPLKGTDGSYEQVKVKPEEAAKALQFYVRITDKALAALAA